MINHSDEYYLKEIEEISFHMPKEFQDYVAKLVNVHTMSYYDIYVHLRYIAAYYRKLSSICNKIAYKITPADIENTNHFPDGSYFILDNVNRKNVAIYHSYLKENGIIAEALVTPPEKRSIISHAAKKRNPRKIKTPADVKLFKDENRPYSKTTIDLKYSLDKEFINGKYTNYVYKIYNHETGTYFSDQDGNTLKIKNYAEARAFIKQLYK
jgi:hypothetical protein